jgi:hypothetical protein
MESCRDDVIGGFNTFVSDQKALGGNLTLIQFDDEYEVVYSETPLDKVGPLTRETFVPRGSTALLDAIGKTIKEGRFQAPPLCIIFTDGLENTSRTYTKAHVKDLIEQKTKEGWTFMYLGANQDAFAEAGSMGISRAQNFDVTRTPDVFRTLSQTASQYV